MNATRIGDAFRNGPEGNRNSILGTEEHIILKLSFLFPPFHWYINVFGTALLSGSHEQSFAFILFRYCDGLI